MVKKLAKLNALIIKQLQIAVTTTRHIMIIHTSRKTEWPLTIFAEGLNQHIRHYFLSTGKFAFFVNEVDVSDLKISMV